MLGYTLLVLLNDNRVVEWDRDGKPRWQIDKLASPLDAEVLPGQRVLIAEHDTQAASPSATSRARCCGRKNSSIAPIHAQRLPGRHHLHRHAQDTARSGPLRQRNRPLSLADGDHHGPALPRWPDRLHRERGSYFELDAAGEELKRFAIGAGVYTTNALTLSAQWTSDHRGLRRRDRAGVRSRRQVVWQIKMGRPLCAVRLPGGNTLVSSQDMVLDRVRSRGQRDRPTRGAGASLPDPPSLS